MPSSTAKPILQFIATHPYYTAYRNNKPVKTVPYPGQNAVWDYSINEFVTLQSGEVMRGQICYG